MTLTENKLTEYQNNPVKFIHDVLDKSPRWDKQKEIIESVRDNRYTYVKACHGVGKTFTAKDVALWFLYTHYPSKVISTAPSWPQVEKLLWSEINSAHSRALAPLGGQCKKTELYIDPEWFAVGLSPRIDTEDDAKRMTGFHSPNMLIIFDEAPACNEKLWDIKETLMTSENVRFLAIGNPVVGSGSFYEAFRQGRGNRINMIIFDSPNFSNNGITCVDDLKRLAALTPEEREIEFSQMTMTYSALTTPRWAVERLIQWGADSPLFQSRVIGEFPEKTTDTIISLSALERCQYVQPTKSKKVLGVDVARFGDDFTCLFGYHNNTQVYKKKFNGQDTVYTANLINNLILTEHYGVVVIDDTGVGGGVTDQVMHFCHEKAFDTVIIPVNFAESSTQIEYDDIVTEMYFTAKELIESGTVNVIDNGTLFSELTGRKYNFTTKGKFRLESKKDYKKRVGGESPDEADAFVLCMWGLTRGSIVPAFDFGDDMITSQMDF